MKKFAPNNGRFKIKNKNGFSDFYGVTKSEGSFEICEIQLNDTVIKTTSEHVIHCDGANKRAKDINIGDIINGINVTSIHKSIQGSPVYDVLNVVDGHHFTIHGIVEVDNCVYCDELGFVHNAEEFYESIYPTITSGKNTKVIITSTPKGMNYFYKMWVEAETGRSEYIAYDVKWYEHPDRDQEWYDTQVKNMNQKAIQQEIECVSGDTVVEYNGQKITMEELYGKYSKLNNSNNKLVYFHE